MMSLSVALIGAVLYRAGAVPTAPRGIQAAEALRRAGVVLLEDVPLEDFEAVAQETWQAAGYPGLQVGDYNSMGSVTRPMVSENVYDVAAGAPKQLPVSPHSEQAYLFSVPRFAAFMCIKAAEKGGELQLFDNVQLGRRLGKLMEKFNRLGITYYRVMGDKLRSANWSYPTGMWQDRFDTDDWLLAKKKASKNLAYGGAELRDYEQGLVVMNWTVPAVTFVNTSGTTEVSRAVLQSILDNHRSRNYAAAADGAASGSAVAALHSTWGDGSELGQEELQRLQEATTQSLEVEVLLRSGQVIVIDNWRFAHGRLPYEGARNHAALISARFPRAEPPKFSVSEL